MKKDFSYIILFVISLFVISQILDFTHMTLLAWLVVIAFVIYTASIVFYYVTVWMKKKQ